MPKHEETRFSPFTPEQLFRMVADVEKYPQFLPWCRAARTTRRIDENNFEAELIISFKSFTESYVSDVTLHPAAAGEISAIEVEMVSGPFEHLINKWRFIPRAEGGTNIYFLVDFKFRSRILEGLIGGLFTKASLKMAQAFTDRATTLYGAPAQA